MVYFITDGGLTKIGKSNNVNSRLRELQVGSSKKLTLINEIQGNVETEKRLHKVFKKYRVIGEWFDLPKVYQDITLEEVEDIENGNKKLISLNTTKLKTILDNSKLNINLPKVVWEDLIIKSLIADVSLNEYLESLILDSENYLCKYNLTDEKINNFINKYPKQALRVKRILEG